MKDGRRGKLKKGEKRLQAAVLSLNSDFYNIAFTSETFLSYIEKPGEQRLRLKKLYRGGERKDDESGCEG